MHYNEFIILGGGIVAGYAAREFVAQEVEPGQLGIISADSSLPYERPTLSKKYLAGEKSAADILINPPEFYDEHEIQVFLNTRVTSLELPTRRLHTDSGEIIQFGKLLIATGAHVQKLAIPGADLDGLYYLRSMADADRIAARIPNAGQVVVIGGGFIGMEVAATLAAKGLKVTIVFPESRLLAQSFTPAMSGFFQDTFEQRGITILPECRPERFAGTDKISRVVLNTGQELPADFVVAGIGVAPATELFEGTGLHVHDGIVVNKYLETNRDGIFAAGDVANYYDVFFQKRRRAEHWDVAVQQSQHVVRTMMAPKRKRREEFIYLRYFFSDMFDLSYEFWGDPERADKLVLRGDVSGGQFSAWWLSGYRLEAAFVMNRPDEERRLAPEWIKIRRRVKPEQLMDESQSLENMAPPLIL